MPKPETTPPAIAIQPPIEPPIKPPGRFAYAGLDRVIHEKARLGLLTSLMAHPKGLLFGDLKQLCGLTDGNLSRHLQVLREDGLVDIEKSFEANRPQTRCRITLAGRQRYLDYLAVLEQIVKDAAAALADAGARDGALDGTTTGPAQVSTT